MYETSLRRSHPSSTLLHAMALDGGNVFADNVGERIQGHLNVIHHLSLRCSKIIYAPGLETSITNGADWEHNEYYCLD